MPTFDIASEVNQAEVHNAVDQCNKEVTNRFDFKGSDARVELADKGKERSLTLYADSDFQIGQVRDVLLAKLSKRGVDIRFVDLSTKLERLGGDKFKQLVPVKTGIDSEAGRRIQGLIKQSKLKVQASIQGDAVRINGAKRDDLQGAIALLKREVTDLPLGFNNFRD
jgi:uncharacterized protein YajQ (UPF0234 family)